MTPEAYAAAFADEIEKAEMALLRVIARFRQWPDTIPIGKVSKQALGGKISGALGMLSDAHLDASRYDPRPSKQDGGDGK